MTNNKIELEEKQLEKVNGGFVFNYNQCPCANFRPYDGDWNNTSAYNCQYFVDAQRVSMDACFENGVCRNYKK